LRSEKLLVKVGLTRFYCWNCFATFFNIFSPNSFSELLSPIIAFFRYSLRIFCTNIVNEMPSDPKFPDVMSLKNLFIFAVFSLA
jgi:hypothetical protein